MNRKILFFLLFFAMHTYVQSQLKYDCKLIKAVLADKQVKREFYIDFPLDKEVVIIDNKLFFQHCSLGKINGKKIRIIGDSSVMTAKYYKGILISNVVKSNDTATVYLYQKSTGAAGNVRIRMHRRKFSVIGVRIGNY